MQHNLKEDSFDNLKVRLVNNKYLLTIDDKQYMAYDTLHEHEIHEVYSHIDLAYGDVISTGLGFGLRERLILEKENVKSLTVLELNKSVIDYHIKLNQPWFNNPKLKIINIDALSYKGKCDSLLIDHFEDPFSKHKIDDWLQQSKTIQNNIQSTVTWVWPLELMVSIFPEPIYNRYLNIKNKYQLNLPDISEEKLFEYIEKFNRSSLEN